MLLRRIAAGLLAFGLLTQAVQADQQAVNAGTAPNAGDGDTLRVSFTKLNANDAELYARIATLQQRLAQLGNVATLNIGTTPGTVADGGALMAEIYRAQAAEQANATALAGKAPLASPAFTGAPTVPTPALGDTSSQIANMAAVSAAIAASPGAPATRQITGAGLATGGGDLTANRTITVPKASASDVASGTDDTKALTALSVVTAFAGKQPLSSNLTALSAGTINGIPIGGTTPAAGSFTSILGDGSGVNVAFPSLATRTLLDRLLERPSVIDYGVDITGTADSTVAFSNAVNGPRAVTAPCGTIRVTDTIKVTTAAARFTGAGDCTFIKYDAPAGTPAKPLIDIQPSATGADFSRFSFDHQGAQYAVSQQYDILTGGVAVIVQADSARVHDVTGRNGYDNCFMAVRFDSSNVPVRGKPQYYEFSNIRTFTCGKGAAHTGAGIDIGSGSNGTVNGLVDNGSYAAFILDIGAGANGSFSNLVGLNTAYDGSKPSYTFYIGDANSTFSNLQSIGAGYRGAWLDGFAYRTTISNLNIKAPAFEGMIVKGGTSALSNVIINSPGYGKTAGTVDAIIFDNTAGPISGLNINGLSIQSEFNTARYGINVAGTNPTTGTLVAAGANAITGAIVNADLSGAVTATNGLPGTFGVVNGAALGGYWTDYTPTVTTGSGAFTTVSASGSYRVVGKTVSIRITVQIVDKGTATDVRVSLPFPARGTIPLTGVESNATAKGVAGAVANGASIATLKFVDGSNAVPASGTTYLLTVGGEYQTP